jgi:hypothetical protein
MHIRQVAKNGLLKAVRVIDRLGLRPAANRGARALLGDKRFAAIRSRLLQESSSLSGRGSGAIISLAPHSTTLYDYFIRTRLANGDRFITSRELYAPGFIPDQNVKYVLLRHDIDYAPEAIEQLTDVERAHGLRSDIYVIVSKDHYYDAFSYADTFRALAREGFVFGLHTLAPQHEDFFSVLRQEIEAYTRLMQSAPRYFTIHGPPSPPERPPDWPQKREYFLSRIGPRLRSFGFYGSHNISGVSAWLEDAAVGGEFSFLEIAWTDPPVSFGKVLGVLTHPCHWIHWPIKWRVDPATRREAAPIDAFVRMALSVPKTDSK